MRPHTCEPSACFTHAHAGTCMHTSARVHVPAHTRGPTTRCTHMHRSDCTRACTHTLTCGHNTHRETRGHHETHTNVQQVLHAALPALTHTHARAMHVCGHACSCIHVCRCTRRTHTGCLLTPCARCAHTHTHRQEPHAGPSPALPRAVLGPGATSLQEISKDSVYTISSKEIIIIITLSDLAVRFL